MLKEKYETLLKEVIKDEDKDFLLETIEDKVSSFPRYVEQVYNMEVLIPILYARYEGEELRDKITNLDLSRRMAHESAIAACSCLNRLCDSFGVPKICPESTNRGLIADFVGKFVYEMFLCGTGHVNGMDDMIELMEREKISSLPRKEVTRE